MRGGWRAECQLQERGRALLQVRLRLPVVGADFISWAERLAAVVVARNPVAAEAPIGVRTAFFRIYPRFAYWASEAIELDSPARSGSPAAAVGSLFGEMLPNLRDIDHSIGDRVGVVGGECPEGSGQLILLSWIDDDVGAAIDIFRVTVGCEFVGEAGRTEAEGVIRLRAWCIPAEHASERERHALRIGYAELQIRAIGESACVCFGIEMAVELKIPVNAVLDDTDATCAVDDSESARRASATHGYRPLRAVGRAE